ncbi:MAG: hypothetical protein JOZ41_20280 [Chloroflexi bacterium]|nr:hypothetical protein [Chloroflexota bacterium]
MSISPVPRVLVTLPLLAVMILSLGTWVALARAAPPPPLRFTASPALVDVGEAVTLTVSATAWPAPASVTVSFVSPHHGFSSPMPWDRSCACFRLAVSLARRIHPIERALAKALVRIGRVSTILQATFSIRGLAPNGRDYAPGGTPTLTAWVSDPNPNQNEWEHFCAWVKTSDGLGVSGFRITFVVHYRSRSQQWVAGTTGTTGILCTHRPIGHVPAAPVPVDVYANSLHVRTTFTPRA